MSFDPAATAQVETASVATVAQSPRVGFVPSRANTLRDGLAVVLLVCALLLPWNVEFGVGIPGSDTIWFVLLLVVTLVAVAGALTPHLGPLRLSGPDADVRRAGRVRLLLSVPYLALVVGFVAFHLVWTVRDGGTGAVPPGAGPGMFVGVAGALLAAQPPITSITVEHNGFRRWYAAARVLGVVSIVLAALAVAFNLFWRLRYLFVTDVAIGARDLAVVVTTVVYGAVAMLAVVIGSRWLIQKTAAARLATTTLGISSAVASTLVWLAPVGNDVDAFHGIAENTSTAAVGYEGYLAWAAAAAIVAPTTLYAVLLIQPPTLGVFRGAAQKCLTLIAFWTFSAAALRIFDYLIALSLDLPRAIYDSAAMTAFNLVTFFIAMWLRRRLEAGSLSAAVIAAFSGVLFVFTTANLVIGVALAPRYADPTPRSPDAVYGNDLAQQITSTFDVAICVLSLTILAAMLATGPLAGWVLKRRAKRPATPAPAAPSAEPATAAAPTVAHQSAPVPRIVRLKDDATAMMPATEAPTAVLRIHRPPAAGGDPTMRAPAPE